MGWIKIKELGLGMYSNKGVGSGHLQTPTHRWTVSYAACLQYKGVDWNINLYFWKPVQDSYSYFKSCYEKSASCRYYMKTGDFNQIIRSANEGFTKEIRTLTHFLLHLKKGQRGTWQPVKSFNLARLLGRHGKEKKKSKGPEWGRLRVTQCCNLQLH